MFAGGHGEVVETQAGGRVATRMVVRKSAASTAAHSNRYDDPFERPHRSHTRPSSRPSAASAHTLAKRIRQPPPVVRIALLFCVLGGVGENRASQEDMTKRMREAVCGEDKL